MSMLVCSTSVWRKYSIVQQLRSCKLMRLPALSGLTTTLLPLAEIQAVSLSGVNQPAQQAAMSTLMHTPTTL